ncbi:MAG: hypothetical protein HDS84_06215 [Bacteroidales bacterium]|nr:hypothetical protein [Bacteroidales bacterium]
MKKSIRFIIIVIVGLMNCCGIHAINKNIHVIKYIYIYNGHTNPDEDPNGRGARIPSHEVPCSIDSSDGIELKGEGNVDIIYYEIWQSGIGCIAKFEDEEDFLKVLFTLKGEYEIHFETANCTYIGKFVL